MAIISLSEAEILKSSLIVPLVYSLDGTFSEPWFDYDDEGVPQDFGVDVEPPDPTVEDFQGIDPDLLLYDVSPSQFAETAIRIPEAGKISDFSFEGREYLRRIYDTSADKVLLKCGRQVEKCELQVVKVLTWDGRHVKTADVKPGDRIIALELVHPRRQKYGPELGTGAMPVETGWRFTTDRVKAKRSVGKRQSYRVVTRMGSEIEVGEDTPILTAEGWLCAGEVEVGARVAAARDISECCHFGEGSGKHPAYVELLGYAIADGGLTGWGVQLTKHDPQIQAHIRYLLDCAETIYQPTKDGKSLTINKREKLVTWLDEDGLLGKRSREKFIPDWVFSKASRSETITFLKRLWVDCDGSVRQQGSKWEIVYASTSRTLAEQVRSLLLKFGIPSRIRRNNHPAYKDDPDTDQHLVRVETIEGVQKFLYLFTDLPTDMSAVGDSNRDTTPTEFAQPLIRQICDDFGFGKRGGRGVTSPMKAAGLRITLKYPLSRAKLGKYLEFFLEYGAENHPAYEKLLELFQSQVIWDEVVEVVDLGEQEIFHLETEKHHNYLLDHLVVHNSTTLGNRLLCYSALTNNFRSLFVAPSAEQAKVFSGDRIKDVIEASPVLRAYTTTKISQAVFYKKFINFSQIRLRYAYLTADRVRGIPADLVCVDEIQDILIDNIPVIEQCAFHSKYKLFLYSGTPKSMDNTIEFYWTEFSTQNEWVVPCEAHGTPKDPSSWHWNILGEKNIGKSGLICDRCGKSISATHPHAVWASMQTRTEQNRDKVTFDGYRIPQIMVPWVDWQEVLEALEQYSRAQFFNEKLGMSYDSGVRPITKAQLQACCQPHVRIGDIENFKQIAQGRQIFAGIDWGPGETTKSYTVISFGGYLGTGNFTIFWIHRFTGQDTEPERQLNLISQMISQLQVKIVATDYGGGFYQNDTLMRRFGQDQDSEVPVQPQAKKEGVLGTKPWSMDVSSLGSNEGHLRCNEAAEGGLAKLG